MANLFTASIDTPNGPKELAVYHDDVTCFPQPIDILTTSAFANSYAPTPRTVFHALYHHGIHVEQLAQAPKINLKDPCNVWLSNEIPGNETTIRRIGCVELTSLHNLQLDMHQTEQCMLNSIQTYFMMLDIAHLYGVSMETVALPLLGSGCQNISPAFILIPLINECIAFLKRNNGVKRILFIEKNREKADLIANQLTNSLRFALSNESASPVPVTSKKSAFISYSSPDKNIADNLCAKLEQKGIKVWYAPRDVRGPYAAAIAQAIDSATHFIVILSKNSIASEHVLNEIDLAFQNLPHNIKFKPLRIDDAIFTPSFKYYLSRQHWMDATHPPLEERLNEFVDSLINEGE